MEVYEDGCCRRCHSRATGKGADEAHLCKRLLEERIRKENLAREQDAKDRHEYEGEDGGSPFE